MCTVSLIFRHHYGLVLAILWHILKVEEGVIEHLKVTHLLLMVLLKLDFYLLVRPAALFGDEIFNSLYQANFVVQT